MHLTPREREVVELLCTGAVDRDISRELGMALQTVKTHLKNIYDKTGYGSRLELVCGVLNKRIRKLQKELGKAGEL